MAPRSKGYAGAMSELRKQFDYYVANQDDLVRQFNGRFIVIADESVAGDFDTELAAYEFGKANFKAGDFMIQRVAPGMDSYSQTFHSRVAI
jgi:hypothetical protein